MRHKFETHYVVFDVLSWLSTKKFKSSSIELILNNAYFVTSQYAYVTKLNIKNSFSLKNAINDIHVEIISKFKKFIMKKYRKKKFWSQILTLIINKTKITMIKKNRIVEKKIWQKVAKFHESDIDFYYRNDFIYHQKNRDKNVRERLCLFQILKKKYF